jgi:hypothetical protein
MMSRLEGNRNALLSMQSYLNSLVSIPRCDCGNSCAVAPVVRLKGETL